jgi:hypothetical protein
MAITRADDRDVLPALDPAAAEDVDGAAQRLARERRLGQRRRQPDDRVGGGEVVFGIGVVGDGGHPLPFQ